MKQLFLGGISLGFHFYFFLAFGSLFRKILGRKEGLNRCLHQYLDCSFIMACLNFWLCP